MTIMTINEYQYAALRTAQTDKLSAGDLLLNSALGLCGESGEVADLVKKHLFQGHDLDLSHVAKELGDISGISLSAHTPSGLTLRAYSA